MSDPVAVSIPVGDRTETDLIAALEKLIEAFDGSLTAPEVARAVTWLNTKYGLTP